MKLLFDCTELSYMLDESGYRAGVFNVSLNLLREFIKKENVEITFLCNFQRYYFMKEIIEKVACHCEEQSDEAILKDISAIDPRDCHDTQIVVASRNDACGDNLTTILSSKEEGEANNTACDNLLLFKNIKLLEEHSLMNKFWGKLAYYTDKMPIRIKYAVKILSRFYDAYFYKVNRKNLEQLKGYDAYFSPFTPPPKEIERANILRIRMLHDAIPIIENGMPKSPKDWYYKIYNSINNKDFYVVNSDYTKRDILKYFPFIKEENIKTTYLGVNEKFCHCEEQSDEAILKDISAIDTPDCHDTQAVVASRNDAHKTQVYHANQRFARNDKYIFSLCSLGKRKNLVFAINNFYEFINKHNIDDLYLVLAGGVWTKFEKELNSTLTKYDKSKIKLLGYVPDEDLPALYSNAHMFIFPSLYEGFGLPVLEAMACGCPVITSNSSSLPEVIGDAGIQINPTSDDDMIQAYEKMYFDSSFREECKQKGLERAKHFTWEKCAKGIVEFIESKMKSD